MGAAASTGLQTALQASTEQEIKEALNQWPNEDLAKLRLAVGLRDGPVRETSYGKLLGGYDVEKTDIEVFKGVPYAKAERFGEPGPPAKWEGTRSATKFLGSPPMMTFGAAKAMVARVPRSNAWLPGDPPFGVPLAKQEEEAPEEYETEDASLMLNLNIWTPAGAQDSSMLPVLVWNHGGAYMIQGPGPSAPLTNGASLAKRGGCVVVSITRRSWGLGFLYKKGGDIPPNLGLLDILAALEWIKSEIKAFGGDRDCVTIFGESEGACSIGLLMGSPFACSSGLFQRASGMSTSQQFMISEDEADNRARAFCEELGSISYDDLCVDKLRAVPLPKLTAAFQAVWKKYCVPLAGPAYAGAGPFYPVHCGKLYPDGSSAYKNTRNGCGRNIPFFLGSIRFEQTWGGTDTIDTLTEALAKRVETTPPNAYAPPEDGWEPKKVFETYMTHTAIPGTTDLQIAYSCYKTDLVFSLSSLYFADAHSANGDDKTFVFRIDWGSNFEAGKKIEIVGHGWDIGVFFGPEKMDQFPEYHGMYDRASPDESRKIAGIMSDMLIAFAKTGNPSIEAFKFPAWGAEAPMVILGTPDCRADISIEKESDPQSRVSLQRKGWGGLWKVPLV